MNFLSLVILFVLGVYAKKSTPKPDEFKWHEQLEGLEVFSVAYDEFGLQHIIMKNTTNENQPSELFVFENNTSYQPASNPNNYTVIPYFSYGVNVTAQYVNATVEPELIQFSHYLDDDKKQGDVTELNGYKTTINITSTQKQLVVKEASMFGRIIGDLLVSSAEHKLQNNVVFIVFGDFHVKFRFTKTSLDAFSDDQQKIVENVFIAFFDIHSTFGSTPGLVLNNFDGQENQAFITFGNSEVAFANTMVVDEYDFATVAKS